MTTVSISVFNTTKTVRGIIALNAIANHPVAVRNPLSADAAPAIRAAIVSAFYNTALALMPYVTDIDTAGSDRNDILSFTLTPAAEETPDGALARVVNAALDNIVVQTTVATILADIDPAVARSYADRAADNTATLRAYISTPPSTLRLTPWR